MPDAEKDAPCGSSFLTQQDRRQLAGWFEEGEELQHVQEVTDAIVAREVERALAPIRDMWSDEHWLEMASWHLHHIRERVLNATRATEHQAANNLPGNMHPGALDQCRVQGCGSVIPPEETTR